MPETKVSEATAETAQVEAPPSEEVVVAPPSEAEPPAQEPAPEETPEQRKERIRKEVLESDEGKAALQSEADKRTLKLRQEYDARERLQVQKTQQETQLREAKQQREQRQGTYRQLQALEQSNPDQWRQHMKDPQYAAIWNEGLNTLPSSEELDAARTGAYNEGFNLLWGQIYQGFMNSPDMADLTSEELGELSRDNFRGEANPHAAYTLALARVYGRRTLKAEFQKELKEAVDEGRADEREKLQTKYREAGIGPEEIEGRAPTGVLTKERYAAMTSNEREKMRQDNPELIDAMSRREMGI